VLSVVIATSVQAASLPDTPSGAIRTTASLSLPNYDCTIAGGLTNRVGQVITGTFNEWVQSYRTGAEGPQITCITAIKPAARQLNRTEAESLLSASRKVGITLAAPSAGEQAQAAIAPATAGDNVSALPVGIDPGAKKATASAGEDAGVAEGGSERTLPQQLNPTTADEPYAILDLGFDVSPVTEKAKPAAAYERPATIGTDDRVHVGDKSESPWSLIGQLVVTWKDGTQTMCTGTLISAHVVLSAGQCAHNRDRGGFASKASFSPGQGQATPSSGITRPAGIRYADYVETNNRWTQISGGQTIQTLDSRSDYAAFYFISPWSVSGTYMPILYGDASVSGVINTAGYPTDIVGAQGINHDMVYHGGTETSRSVNLLRAFQVREYSIDVSAGQNGAPFWAFDGTTRSIIGVVSYGGDEVAGGVWFGGENQTIVTAFMNWTPAVGGPAHIADSLRVPLAIPSGDLSSDSYIRLYNPTAQAGTVTIAFNDGETGQALGTWVSPSLPPFSALQYPVATIEPAAGINPTGRSRYTLQMSASFPGFFQHVIWNRNGISLTNTSGCGNGVSNDVVHLNSVHSSLFVNYPSVVFAHNAGSKPANAVIAVYDAANGNKLGGVVIPGIPANATAAFRLNEVEAALGITPAPGQFHYNLVQEGDFPGYLQHLVYNTAAGLITNMTAKCGFPLR